MTTLYKITKTYVKEYHENIDYIESKYRIEFPNFVIYKNHLDEILVNLKEGFVAFTYKSYAINELQEEIIKLIDTFT